MKEPVRLLTGGSADVQDLLRSAAADVPMRVQLDQLGARLAPTVAAPATGGLLPWLLAGSALLGGAGVVVLARDRQEPPTTTARVVDTQPAPRPSPPEVAPPIVATVSPDPVPAPAHVPTTKRAEPPAKPVTRPPVVPPTPPPPIPRELELLTPAQTALHANDFALALALADRHAGLYPTGTVAEEREAIAIEALHALGQRDRANARFTAFTTHYPHSGYRARLERTVRE